jgi:hypothetical protein
MAKSSNSNFKSRNDSAVARFGSGDGSAGGIAYQDIEPLFPPYEADFFGTVILEPEMQGHRLGGRVVSWHTSCER